MRTTRSNASRETPTTSKPANSTTTMETNDPNPPKLFVLPEGNSDDARIVTLANPRTSAPNRYYFCPEKGIYEFTKIAAPRSAPRSVLLAPKPHTSENAQGNSSFVNAERLEDENKTKDSVEENVPQKSSKSAISNGYVSKSADVFVATPIDPIFLLLPTLSPAERKERSEPPKRMFLSADDYFEALSATSTHFAHLIKLPSFREKLESRLAAVCDTVDAGDEKMYRLNDEKLLKDLLTKAYNMVQRGLPSSMEENFITRALEAPVMSIKREDTTISVATTPSTPQTEPVDNQTELPTPSELASSGVQTPKETTTSQQTAESQASSATSLSTQTDLPFSTTPSVGPDPHISHLLRLRVALDFIFASYVPANSCSRLNSLLSANDPISLALSTSPYFSKRSAATNPDAPTTKKTTTISFAPLTAHLAHLAALRAEALASRSLGDFSRKRGLNGGGGEDDETAETRAEKKRKKEEEEKKRKAGESRALRDLKKVDTSGMRKLSDFFVKKQPAGGKGKTK